MLSKGQTEHFMFYQKRFSSRLCSVRRPIPVPFSEKIPIIGKKGRIKPQFLRKKLETKLGRQFCLILNLKNLQ